MALSPTSRWLPPRYLPGTAQGLQPLASRCYGQGEREGVSRLSGYAVKTAVFSQWSFMPSSASLHQRSHPSSTSEGNRTLSELAVEGMRIYFAGYFFAGISIVATALLSATAHVNKAMAIALCRSCVILVPCVFLLSRLFKMTGVWPVICRGGRAGICAHGSFSG